MDGAVQNSRRLFIFQVLEKPEYFHSQLIYPFSQALTNFCEPKKPIFKKSRRACSANIK
jgi:hypothetical protein